MESRITVIIPVRADVEGLRITLNSLFRTAPEDQAFDIIVANDGGDAEISAVCAKSELVKEVRLTPNRGPGGARNEAISQATGELIAFLDADVDVQQGWWEALRAGLQEHDYVAGRVDINEKMIKSFFHIYDKITAFDVKGYMQRHHGATANLAVRKSLIDSIGAFDARFRSGEDTEFGIRAHESGARMVYADKMLVLHPPRDFTQQRRKIYRVVLGHLQLASTFPARFDKYKLTPRLALSLVTPPRKLAKDSGLLRKYDIPMKIMLYCVRYASRLYILGCYLALSKGDTKNKKHDLS